MASHGSAPIPMAIRLTDVPTHISAKSSKNIGSSPQLVFPFPLALVPWFNLHTLITNLIPLSNSSSQFFIRARYRLTCHLPPVCLALYNNGYFLQGVRSSHSFIFFFLSVSPYLLSLYAFLSWCEVFLSSDSVLATSNFAVILCSDFVGDLIRDSLSTDRPVRSIIFIFSLVTMILIRKYHERQINNTQFDAS
ncbi:hypothetical protein L218DRAFT_349332 [Marasmius fiardii PR-910]|nr:hypothetical protein L218DRAFT_349332 [Marasmius fiardii PR-910]